MGETVSKRAAKSAAANAKPTVRRAAKLAEDLVILVREAPPDSPRDERPIEVARVVARRSPGEGLRLVLASGQRLEVASTWWEEVRSELKDLVREELAPLDVEARERVMQTLIEATVGHDRYSFELSSALHGIREVLRERLPRGAVDEHRPAGLSVEQILAVDDRSFWISGWVHDDDGQGTVTLVSPESARSEILQTAHRYERSDVVQFYSSLGPDRTRDHGFTAFFTLASPSMQSRGWIAELRTSDGLEVEVQCPPVVGEAHAVRSTILGELSSRGQIGGALAAEHGRHALTRLQGRIVAEAEVASIDSYGAPPRSPSTSIVVPLYKRLDLIEHQLLQFSRDPDIAGSELIYVLDSVEQADELAAKARELFALYGLPFKVLNLSSGAGFAGASNHGVAASRAKRLLLLNSDVIPSRPGWIAEMSEFYDATEGIGALGPKLLYEDDSLQHAGLYFHRAPGSQLWENAHCFKGLHRSFPAANVARPVPAVTAACMMVDRERYEEVGGLPVHYVQGDYEDSELCLRLARAGRENWYLPAVELYHLEGQSYVPGLRRVPSEYNMWLHSALWGDQIEQAMAAFDAHATVEAGHGGTPQWRS
ncbi:MAG TPA: glycosyltransferase [Solirubrobacteraceae bacterium]|nr:glycosyltransferase [Solirubrobacteraceae bacterium]